MPALDYRHDCYVAYCGTHAAFARSLHDALHARGLAPYLDAEQRDGGAFPDRLASAQRSSWMTVVLLGPHEPSRHPWFESEVQTAINLRRDGAHGIVVIRLPEWPAGETYQSLAASEYVPWTDPSTTAKELSGILGQQRLRSGDGRVDPVPLAQALMDWVSAAGPNLAIFERAWRACGGPPAVMKDWPDDAAGRTLAGLIHFVLLPASPNGEPPPHVSLAAHLLGDPRLQAAEESWRVLAWLQQVASAGGTTVEALTRTVEVDGPAELRAYLSLLVQPPLNPGEAFTVEPQWGRAPATGPWSVAPERGEPVTVQRLEELAAKVGAWIDHFDTATSALFVEIVVPLAALRCAPDRWPLPRPSGRGSWPLGHRYHVTLRLAERCLRAQCYYTTPQYLADWRAAMKSALRDGSPTCCVPGDAVPSLPDRHAGALALAFAPTEDQLRDLLDAAVPVALWPDVTQEPADTCCAVDRARVLQRPIREWREAVRLARIEGRPPGAPAALLWDDPDRRFDEFDYDGSSL